MLQPAQGLAVGGPRREGRGGAGREATPGAVRSVPCLKRTTHHRTHLVARAAARRRRTPSARSLIRATRRRRWGGGVRWGAGGERGGRTGAGASRCAGAGTPGGCRLCVGCSDRWCPGFGCFPVTITAVAPPLLGRRPLSLLRSCTAESYAAAPRSGSPRAACTCLPPPDPRPPPTAHLPRRPISCWRASWRPRSGTSTTTWWRCWGRARARAEQPQQHQRLPRHGARRGRSRPALAAAATAAAATAATAARPLVRLLGGDTRCLGRSPSRRRSSACGRCGGEGGGWRCLQGVGGWEGGRGVPSSEHWLPWGCACMRLEGGLGSIWRGVGKRGGDRSRACAVVWEAVRQAGACGGVVGACCGGGGVQRWMVGWRPAASCQGGRG